VTIVWLGRRRVHFLEHFKLGLPPGFALTGFFPIHRDVASCLLNIPMFSTRRTGLFFVTLCFLSKNEHFGIVRRGLSPGLSHCTAVFYESVLVGSFLVTGQVFIHSTPFRFLLVPEPLLFTFPFFSPPGRVLHGTQGSPFCVPGDFLPYSCRGLVDQWFLQVLYSTGGMPLRTPWQSLISLALFGSQGFSLRTKLPFFILWAFSRKVG